MTTIQTNTLPEYPYGSARTMVHLRGLYLRECFDAWKQAEEDGIMLPETDDPGYVSLEKLWLSGSLRGIPQIWGFKYNQ